MIVPDPALMAQRFIPGLDPTVAERVLAREQRWAVPRVWRSFFRETVAARVRSGALPLERALTLEAEAVKALAGRDVDSEARAVLKMVVASGCPAALCEFAWLARSLSAPLITTDRALLASFPEHAVHPDVFLARRRA
ncbi:MAG TPA: hypothetical protein VFR81_01770 [Longimicrobium sp.]|nr:hypothetical protein [Longimicrobium sp.]